MTAALLGPVGAAPPASGSGSSSGSGSASGSGDGARGELTFAGLLSILAGSPAAGAEAGSPAPGTPTPASGKGGRHASGPDDDAAQTPAAAVAGTLVATVLTTGGTVPLALPNTPGSPADAITATATAGAAPTAVASAAAGSLTAGSASGTARPAPMAGHAGFATTLTAAGAPGAQSGTQPGGIATTLPVTGPDGSAQPVPPQQATQNPAAPNPAAPNPAAPQPTTPQPTSGPVQPAPLDAEPVLPGAIAAGTAAQRIAAQGSKHTHVSPQQPLPIAGEAASHTDASQLDPSQLNPGQLGSAPLPQAAPSAPLPPVVAPTPNYAGVPVDPQPELSGALARLRSHGDGSHELTVSLHPAELGAVNVSAMLRGDQLTVTVACSSDAARAAVTAALPNLHHQLAGAGFGGVDVQFGSPSQNPSQNPAQGHREPAPGQDQPSGRHRAPEQPTAPERRRPAQDAALDRLL